MASERLTCPNCNGHGDDPKARYPWMKQCRVCSGTGYVEVEVGKPIKTNGDRIRSMDDTQLAHLIHELVSSDFFCRICPKYGKCVEVLNTDGDIPDIWCEETIKSWLKVPFDEKPDWIFEDKQESGLLED